MPRDIFAGPHADPYYTYYVATGSSFQFFVDSDLTNLHCSAASGDPVSVSYGMEDFGLYADYFVFSPKTVGATSITCKADPRAQGTLAVVVTLPPVSVTMTYVRNPMPTGATIDPTVGGELEVLSGFVLSNGAGRIPQACEGSFLSWDASSQTLTCRVKFAQETAVNVLTAACVDDPASSHADFAGGAISVNGTLLTSTWSGSRPAHQCVLFMVDSNGVVTPAGGS